MPYAAIRGTLSKQDNHTRRRNAKGDQKRTAQVRRLTSYIEGLHLQTSLARGNAAQPEVR